MTIVQLGPYFALEIYVVTGIYTAMKAKFLSVLLVLLATVLNAQRVYEWEDTVRTASEQIFSSGELTARAASLKAMPDLLQSALDRVGSFAIDFDSSRISIVYAPDSSFRILTGQAILQDTIKYYGVLQRKDDERNPIHLHDALLDLDNNLDVPLSAEQWAGALYYNIIETQVNGQTYYIAFGFAAQSYYESSKVAEVIFFKDDRLHLGAPIFKDVRGQNLHRLGIVYSSDVGAKLNYDSTLQMIIYDHLIPMKSPYKQRNVLMVPDGSYRGYVREAGEWVYVDKVFNQVSLKPPREAPVLDGEKGKDLFGRTNKNR